MAHPTSDLACFQYREAKKTTGRDTDWCCPPARKLVGYALYLFWIDLCSPMRGFSTGNCLTVLCAPGRRPRAGIRTVSEGT